MNLTYQSLTPAQFAESLNPTWARIYVEVFDSLKQTLRPDELVWQDSRVTSAFCRLLGIDIEMLRMTAQHQPLTDQLAIIRLSRIAAAGLYQADEVAQLDGQQALDYALGWMSAYRWLQQEMIVCPSGGAACSRTNCPSDDFVTTVAQHHMAPLHPAHRDNFMDGFSEHVRRTVGTPGCCALANPQVT